MMASTKEGCAMLKKYIVRLTEAERDSLRQVVAKLKGTSQKVRRAQVLLKGDVDGPGWTDVKIADAFGCRSKTVENIRQRFVTKGFDLTLDDTAVCEGSALRDDRTIEIGNSRMAPAQQRQATRRGLAVQS